MSNVALYASLAANAVTVIGALVLTGRFGAKLAETRLDLVEAEETVGDLRLANGMLEQVNGTLLEELTEYRAAEAKRRAPLIKANAARAAKAASTHAH